jgi:hypothetical protein
VCSVELLLARHGQVAGRGDGKCASLGQEVRDRPFQGMGLIFGEQLGAELGTGTRIAT